MLRSRDKQGGAPLLGKNYHRFFFPLPPLCQADLMPTRSNWAFRIFCVCNVPVVAIDSNRDVKHG
jgi:hypothetical protein